MSYELRSITPEEVAPFRAAIALGFGEDANPQGHDRFLSLMPLERTVAVFDGDSIVGTLGDFDLQLTVPGGNQVDMAGTTMVGVRPTHTRRGILRSMMDRHLDNAVKRGEPVAGLWASEPGIYGRFGFGMAVECHSVKIDARQITAPPIAADLQIEMLAGADLLQVVAPFWTKIARERAGFIERGTPRWQDLINDPEYQRGGSSAGRHIVARRDGDVVGYLAYRQTNKWDGFTSESDVSINALVAADLDAHLALWAYALDVDLFPHVSYWDGAIDDPLAYYVSEARGVRRLVADGLYVRILDVQAALVARSYEQDGQIVFTVIDDMGYAEGTFALTVRDGVATVAESSEPAAVSLGIRELSALYLGRVCADLYAQTGHINGAPPAVRSLGQIFATARAPWCPEMF